MEIVALAPSGFERPLQEEIGARLVEQHERLFVLNGAEPPVWAQNVWLSPAKFEFKSISEAVKHLRGIQRNWWPHSVASHRRAKLIQEQLPPLKKKALEFPTVIPTAPLGSFSLLDDNTMIYSAACSSPFPDGEVDFVENKTGPPSRAYLKLWELFTLVQKMPKKGERVLDLGSSPGGWTWVLDQLGCEVISVDKAPLATETNFSERVKYVSESAFALDPLKFGKVDWLFSDVICYPDRLHELVKKWMAADSAGNYVCTVKFQGPTDFAAIQAFKSIPGGTLRHLHCNKHELTWSLI